MIDNFKHIEMLLDFTEKNTFYFVQILQRRKENPDMRTGVRVINNYYLYELQDLTKLREKIVSDCAAYNARAYINLNRLDLEKIALYTMKQIADYIVLGDFKAVKNAYSAACGSHHSEKEKRWVIDIDEEHLSDKEAVREYVNQLHTEMGEGKGKVSYKILTELPTRTGVHLISNPFNLQKFKEKFPQIDVQKNSPTVLYINS
jgi:hypothetical protein